MLKLRACNPYAKKLVNRIIGCLNNEHSAIYNPDAYEQIVRTGSEIISQDMQKIRDCVFSNTDSIGFCTSQAADSSLINTILNDLNIRNHLRYELEYDFSVVRFVNVNRYAGITASGDLILKGFPKNITNNAEF